MAAMDPGQPSDNTYITGLPIGTDMDAIVSLFGSVGATVKQVRVQPPRNDASGVHALVRFATVEEAKQIVQNFNGQTLKGHDHPLAIKYATQKPRTDGYGAAPVQGWHNTLQSPYAATEKANALYVMGLPPDSTDESVMQFFMEYGNVANARLLKANDHAGGKRAAFIEFDSEEVARTTREQLDGTTLAATGEPLRIKSWAKGGGKGVANTGGNKIKEIVEGLVASRALPGCNVPISDDSCIVVSGIPADATDFHFFRIFSTFGPITSYGIEIMRNEDGQCVGSACVSFMVAQSAQNAITVLNGCQLPDGTLLSVSLKPSNGGNSDNMSGEGFGNDAWDGKASWGGKDGGNSNGKGLNGWSSAGNS